MKTLRLLALIYFCILAYPSMHGQSNIKYGENYFVFEAEDTSSPLDLWVKRMPSDPKYYKGNGLEAINKTYLEFTGNNKNGGTPKSPLEYKFICPKTADYRVVMRMYQPLLDSEAGDKRNDLWIKLHGNYTSACRYPKEILETNEKFWGRGVRKWGCIYNLEAHVNEKKVQAPVIYHLIKDEEYTFTISGRAQGCSIDYILFFENSLGLIANTQDLATQNPVQYRPYDNSTPNNSVESIGLNKVTLQLNNANDTYQLIASVLPTTATDKTVSWSSSNNEKATVSETGLVTAITDGEVIITAKTNDGNKTATCRVNVGAVVVQNVKWTARNITGETDVITDGVLLEAINFAGGTDAASFNTTINGVPFDGAVNGDDSNEWLNPTSNYFSANSINVAPSTMDMYETSIGIDAFDELMSQFIWTGGEPTVVSLSNLTIGEHYKLQFLLGDTRASQSGCYVVIDNTFGNKATTSYAENNGLSIVGEFTAIKESFSFTFSKVSGNGNQGIILNGFQLRETEETGVHDNLSDLDFNILPNPASNWFVIKGAEKSMNAQISIFNVNGRIVYSELMKDSNMRINASELSRGVYFIQLRTENSIGTKKIIIE